jgi:aryl-alcohol dehydrogenase-like predicted oxidoreductase
MPHDSFREEEREMIKYCEFAGIGLIPFSVLAYGKLSRPLEGATSERWDAFKDTPFIHKQDEAEREIIHRVEKVAKDKGWLMSQVAIAWVGATVTSPLVGISSVRPLPCLLTQTAHVPQVKRLDDAIVPSYKLTDEERKYLEEP